jgi:hypothetical protein
MRVSKVALRVLTPAVALLPAVATATPIAPALARSGAIAAPAAVVAADTPGYPPKTAAVPQSVQAPAQSNCSAWLPIDAELSAGVCISQRPVDQYWVNASVLNRSGTQHTVAIFVYFRVGPTWATSRNFLRAQCGASVDGGKITECTTRLTTIRRPTEWKWGVAHVVHTDENSRRTVWNGTPLG